MGRGTQIVENHCSEQYLFILQKSPDSIYNKKAFNFAVFLHQFWLMFESMYHLRLDGISRFVLVISYKL